MDIRTKLALALVSVSLLSMLVLGSSTYQTAFELLRQVSERNLDALAESKQRDLEKVIESWRDRVELIRSRTRLRVLLAQSTSRADDGSRDEVRRIVADAVDAVQSLERVTLFDAQGQSLLSVGTSELPPRLDRAVFDDPDTVYYGGTEILDGDRVAVRFQASLQLDGEMIGALEAIIDADDILTVTQNYTGLGDSGEAIVAVADEEGRARVLAPLRHDPSLRHFSLASSTYWSAALGGEKAVFRSGERDYRGADVWCATRTLPSVGWGLVVKIDSAEESRRADHLRNQMVDLGLALGAVAILGGTLLGFRLGRPLRELTEVVERVRGGERDLRADTTAPDEVGFLAEAVNELLDEQQSDP